MDEEDDSKIFPQKLMEILSNPDNTEAICWMPHGKSFIIRDRSAFAEQVMPRYFSRKAKYSSFTRKLNRWNFSRVSSGPEMGAYYHEFFLRDKPQLAAQMFCKNARTLAAMQSAKGGKNMKEAAAPLLMPNSRDAPNPPALSLSKDNYGVLPAMSSRYDLFERQLLLLQQEEEANRLLLERALMLQSHHHSPVSLNPLLMREVQQQKLQQERILQMRQAMHQYNTNRNGPDRQRRAPSGKRASAA